MRRGGLSAEEQRFIESMGLYFERQGVPRIGGRILGLLLLAEEPVALGRIAELLRVSPASVSTNMRQFLAGGMAELASIPGDRRHYYVFSRGGWERRLQLAAASTEALSQLCQQALENPGLGGKAHLRDALEFCDFFREELAGAAERWRTRRARASAPSLPSSPPRQRRTAAR
jgi:hypothetical protein